jgi:Fe-S-cluster-containing dehydrogenase component
MVKEYALIVNTADCVGCSACVVACKQSHNLPVGPKWIKVDSEAPCIIDGKRQLRYAVTHCMHCSHPACLEACPVKAIIKRQDGIVLIDKELCVGCKACIDACPLGAIMRRKH